jgi:hypothetical protein
MIDFSHWPFMRVFSRWFAAANNAIEGILHAAKTQRHLQFHLAAAFSVLLGCFVIGLDKHEFAIIALITILVIVRPWKPSSIWPPRNLEPWPGPPRTFRPEPC